VSPSCTPTTRHRCGPAERLAGVCGGETLTGCAGVDDGEIGIVNDDAGGAAAAGCVAAAMAAADPTAMGGATAANAWLSVFCKLGAADCGTMPGGGSADAAHCSGGAAACWPGPHEAGGGANAGGDGCG